MDWKRRLRDSLDFRVEEKPFQGTASYDFEEKLIPRPKRNGTTAIRALAAVTATAAIAVALWGGLTRLKTAPPVSPQSSEDISVPSELNPPSAPESLASDSGSNSATTSLPYLGYFNNPLTRAAFFLLPSGQADRAPQPYDAYTDCAAYYYTYSNTNPRRLFRRDLETGEDTDLGEVNFLADTKEWVFYSQYILDYPIGKVEYGETVLGTRTRIFKYSVATGEETLLYSYEGSIRDAAIYDGYLFCGSHLSLYPNPEKPNCLLRIDIGTGETTTLLRDDAALTPFVFEGKLYLYADMMLSLQNTHDTVTRIDTEGQSLQTVLDVVCEQQNKAGLVPSSMQMVNGFLFIQDEDTIYCVRPDQPGELEPIYVISGGSVVDQERDMRKGMELEAATDTHLYFLEYDYLAPYTNVTFQLYSLEISTGSIQPLYESTTILD